MYNFDLCPKIFLIMYNENSQIHTLYSIALIHKRCSVIVRILNCLIIYFLRWKVWWGSKQINKILHYALSHKMFLIVFWRNICKFLFIERSGVIHILEVVARKKSPRSQYSILKRKSAVNLWKKACQNFNSKKNINI